MNTCFIRRKGVYDKIHEIFALFNIFARTVFVVHKSKRRARPFLKGRILSGALVIARVLNIINSRLWRQAVNISIRDRSQLMIILNVPCPVRVV